MSFTKEQLQDLQNRAGWQDIINDLEEIVKTDDADIMQYHFFIKAVSVSKSVKLFSLAYFCFVKANKLANNNSKIIKDLYTNIEPVIDFLGYRFFDDANSRKIPEENYLQARFILQIKENKYFEAVKTINQLIDKTPKVEYYLQRSKIYYLQRRFKETINDYNTAIALSPVKSKLYYQRGEIKQKLKDFDGAEEDFSKAILINPNISLYYYTRGVLYQDKKMHKNAVEDFKKAVRLDNNDEYAYQELAWSTHKLNRSEEAENYINEAISINNKNCSSHFIKGLICNSLRKYEEASESLERAIRTDNITDKQWSAKVWYQKAFADFKLKKIKEAESEIDYAMKLHQNIVTYILLAMEIRLFGKKDYKTAQDYCRQVLNLEPENQRARKAEAEIRNNIA